MNRIKIFLPISAFLLLSFAFVACSSSSLPKDPMDAMRALLPGRTALSGLTLKDTAIVFERNTVWDHLGQRAEMNLNNGLDKMSTATYASSDNSSSMTIDLILYQEHVNAFTMFALERNPEARFLDILEEAYILGDTLGFLKGKYYGRILRSGSVPDTELEKAARMITDKIIDSVSAFPKQLDVFPTDGRVPHSVFMLARTQDRAEEVPEFYGCQYIENADTVTLYFMLNSRVGISTATETLLGKEGRVDQWLMEGQYQSLVGLHPTLGTIFCAQNGSTLAAVSGYSDLKNAKSLVERFFQSFTE